MLKKIIKISLLVLLIGCCVAYLVCYCCIKEETIAFTNEVIRFLNQPLPIISISLLTVGAIILKLVSMSNWGKKSLNVVNGKIAEYKDYIEKGKIELENYKSVLNEQLDSKEQEIKDLKELVYKIIELNPNKKIKELANYELEKAKDQLKSKIDEIKSNAEKDAINKVVEINTLKSQLEMFSEEQKQEILSYIEEAKTSILNEVGE